MKKDQMSEYSKAFNEGGEVESAEDMNVAEQTNETTDAAPEGAADTPAVAVVIAEGAPDGAGVDDAPVEAPAEGADEGASTDDAKPVDYEQKYKTLQGKYNAEVQRLKAELAAREAAMQGDVAQMAEGGEVEQMDEMTEVGDEAEAGDEDLFTEGEGETEAAPVSADPIEQLAADYGPEFVAALDGLIERRARAIVEEMGGAFANEIDGKINEILTATNEGFGMLQGEMLRSVVDDIDDVLESEEFGAWVDGLPDEEKAQAQQVIDAGLPSQGVKLIRKFKQRDTGPTPEDVWAEDAAVAVKGKSPMRLPDRPAMSPEDQYKAAFNAA